MLYFNPSTSTEKTFNEVCSLYNTSFPIGTAIIANTWYKIHAQDFPVAEKGYRFEKGDVQLIDGVYTRTWKKIPLTEEELRNEAYTESTVLLTASALHEQAQKSSFPPEAFSLFAKAGLFDEWAPDVRYSKGSRLVCDGIVYEVQQDAQSIESQPPFAAGMLALYRPLSVDPETGGEPDGSKENPYSFIYGMDVHSGKYYSYNNHLYLAKSDMTACVWPPDTEGLWQWELVN